MARAWRPPSCRARRWPRRARKTSVLRQKASTGEVVTQGGGNHENEDGFCKPGSPVWRSCCVLNDRLRSLRRQQLGELPRPAHPCASKVRSRCCRVRRGQRAQQQYVGKDRKSVV